jgi:hypothetical protein
MKDLAMWVCELGGHGDGFQVQGFFLKKLELDPIQKRKPFTF